MRSIIEHCDQNTRQSMASWKKFDELYNHALQPNSQFVYLVDEMIKMLFALDGAYKKRIHPKQVGIHNANREGLGIVDESVHSIGLDIDADGFVWKAVEDACCVEDGPNKVNAKFTIQSCNPEENLASFNLQELEYASVACTHTNQFLAAVIDGASTDHDCIAIDGRLSVGKVGRNKNARDALEKGLEWTVIKHEVEVKYPEVPALIQRAKNKVGTTQRRPDSWQSIAFISKLMQKQMENQQHIDFARILKHVIQSKPLYQDDIPNIIEFMKIYGGKMHTDALVTFARKHVAVGHRVPGALFKALASMPLKPSELVPNFAHAVIKTCAAAKTKVIDGSCNFISPSDVTSNWKVKKQAMLDADSIMVEMGEMHNKVKVSNMKEFNKALCLLVRFVYKKPLGSPAKIQSIYDIACDFADALRETNKGAEVEQPTTWSRTTESSDQPCSQESTVDGGGAAQNFVAFDDHGKAACTYICIAAMHAHVYRCIYTCSNTYVCVEQASLP